VVIPEVLCWEAIVHTSVLFTINIPETESDRKERLTMFARLWEKFRLRFSFSSVSTPPPGRAHPSKP
jgi:hypothetical protein